MKDDEKNQEQLRSSALCTADPIFVERQFAMDELAQAKRELEAKGEELASSLARMRAVLESTTDGILVTDGRGVVTHYNEKFLAIWNIVEPLPDLRSHDRLLEFTSKNFRNPDEFRNRIKDIYENCPQEAYDFLELNDGRFIERFSRVQLLEGENIGRVWSFREVTESIRTKQEANEQREWYEVTLASIGDAVITSDLKGVVNFVNPEAERLTGWNASDALGQPLESVFRTVDETTRHPAPCPIANVLAQHHMPGSTIPALLLSKDGQEIPINNRVAPIRTGEHTITGVVIVFHDVTPQMKTAAELRQSENRKAAILDSSLDAIITIDHLGAVSDFNRAAEVTFGYRRDEAAGKELAALIIPERLRGRHRLGMQHYLSTGEGPALGKRIEMPALHADGHEFPIELSITRIEGFEPPMFTATLRDIADSKKLADELAESQTRLRLAMEAGGMGDWEWCISSGTVSWSPSLHNIHGLQPGTFGGDFESFKRDIHPADLPRVLSTIQQSIENKTDYVIEYRITKPDGKQAWLEARGKVFVDESGNVLRMAGVCMDATSRKEADDALVRSEQFNRSIIESSRDSLKTLSLDGTLLWMNTAGQKALGIEDVSHVLAKPWIEFWNPSEQMTVAAALDAARAGASGTFVGSRNMHGRVTWWEVVITPILDENGLPERLLAVSRDVTDRKQQEEELRKSEAQFRQLADAMPQIVWVSQPDGHVNYFNRRWYEFTGLPKTLTNAPLWVSVIHPDDVAKCLDLWSASIQSGAPYEIEYRIKGSAGDYRWHLGRALAATNQCGQIQRWYGSCTDIHEQRTIAEALKEEYSVTEQLNGIANALSAELDLTKVVQIIIDAATRITRAQFGAFFYNQSDDTGGSYILYAISGVPKSAFDAFPLPRATALFGPTFRGECTIRLDDVRTDPRFGGNSPHHGMPQGHLPVVSYLASPVISRSGEVIGGLFFGHSEPGIFNDRDEKIIAAVAAQAASAIDAARLYQAEQQARAAAEEASRAKDHFIAALSHELRTPLTPVLAILSSIREEGRAPQDIQEDLETIRRNVALEAHLIDDLLDLTRISKGKLELVLERVHVGRLIENAISTCLPDINAGKFTICREYAEGNLEVVVDVARITQVLWNFVKNAVKFTPPGGTITVRAGSKRDSAGAKVLIEVSDTGIGIETQQLHRVFNAFEQGGREVTRQFGGLGLGLAISKAIADAHHGTIEAHSDGAGLGSVFTLALPWDEEISIASPVTPSGTMNGLSPTPHAATPARILLVEDHSDTASILTRILRRMGHEVFHAPTVQSALEVVAGADAQQPFSLVMSDLGLPDGSGLDLMRTLSAKYGLRGIALSGFGMESDIEQSKAAGFEMHFTKPVDVSALRRAVNSMTSSTLEPHWSADASSSQT